jgi:hypothetical protein
MQTMNWDNSEGGDALAGNYAQRGDMYVMRFHDGLEPTLFIPIFLHC